MVFWWIHGLTSISESRLPFAQPCRAGSFRPVNHSPENTCSPPGSVQHG